MKSEIIAAEEMDDSLLNAWDQLLAESGTYRNPNLSPWFTMALAPYRQTFVGMLWQDNTLAAIMPFHVTENGIYEAIAIGVSDYHGPVFHSEYKIGYLDFLHKLGIGEFIFDHLIADTQIKPLNLSWQQVNLINLSKGEIYYKLELREKGSLLWHEIQNKIRKLCSRYNSVIYKPCIQSSEVLDLLITLKSNQFVRNNVRNDFEIYWNRPFLHSLLKTQKHPAQEFCLQSL